MFVVDAFIGNFNRHNGNCGFLINEDCTKALLNVSSRIDLNKISAMIDEIPLITEVEKIFYKFMLKERKIRILDKAIEILSEKELE